MIIKHLWATLCAASPSFFLFIYFSFVTFSIALAPDVYANPQGGVVGAGGAVISTPAPNTVQINQTTQNAVINWQSYNVAQHEQVNYHQPNAQSISLNRINPANGVSQIFGSINANGRVWLLNPAGIWFGPTSNVNVAGLLATTAGISNDDFMSGNYHFVQAPGWNGSIINEGYIAVTNAGLVALVGPNAVNRGNIVASFGTVVLGSGKSFTVDFAGDSLLQFDIGSEYDHPLASAVENSGTIIANGGKIQMTAKVAATVLDNAINMSGIAIANSVNMKNGSIILSAGNGRATVTGTLSATGLNTGETGGTIHILGNEVVLAGHAVVNASGDAGGGTILVGGNAHGLGQEQRASYAFMGSNASMLADATRLGNGGKIVLWSDLGTQFYGSISAKGGALGGDGGWVETSGKEYLVAQGAVIASAVSGANGKWLLDPRNVTITNTTTNGAFDGGNPNIYTPVGDTATVSAATINASLNAGTDVEVNTGSTGTQAGNITVTSAISKSAGATTPTLTLRAAGAIALNAAIGFTSGGLGLVLISGGAITQTAALTLTTLSANAGASAITLTNAGNNFVGAMALTTTNSAAVRDTNALIMGTSNVGGALTITTNGALTQTGALTVAGTTTIAAGAANNILLTDAANDFATIAITTGLNTSVTDSNTLNFGTSTVSGTLDVITNGAITQSGVIAVAAGATTLSAGAANNITLSSANNFATVNIVSGNNVSLRDSNAIALGAINAASSLTVVAAGAITQVGNILTPVLVAKTLGTNLAITLNSAGNEVNSIDLRSRNAGDTANSGGAITYRDATGFNIAGMVATTSTVTLTAGDTITQTNGVGTGIFGSTLTAKTLNNSGAAITLTNPLNNFATADLRVRNAGDTADAAAAISYTDLNAIAIAAAQTLSTVDILAGGAITQTGALSGTTLTAKTFVDAGAAITLNLALGNAFSVVNLFARNLADTANAAGAIAYRSVTGFDIGGIGTTSTLSLQNNNAVGNVPITQSGAIAAGVTTIISGATNDVLLANLANNFSTVALTSGLNVTLRDSNDLILGVSTISGNFDLATNGAITQSGAVIVNGSTTFDAGAANNITLATTTNNFNTVNITNANNVVLRDANAIVLGPATIGGTFGVTTSGSITQVGTLIVNGATTLAAGAANNITLTDANNNFNSVAMTSALNVSLVDVNALVLGTSTVSGTLDILINGALTQIGAVAITGLTTLTVNALNDILLTNAGNNFASVNVVSGNNVALRDVSGIILSAATAASSLTVIAGGAITQVGSIVTPTLVAKTLGTNLAITLNNANNEVNSVDLRSRNAGDTANSGGAITYRDATGFDVGNTIATTSTVTLTAGGPITQTGGVGSGIFGSTLTAKTFNNSGAAITLANALNALTTIDLRVRNSADTANVAAPIAYADANAIAIAAANTLSTVDIVAGGAITQTGSMTGTTLTAKTLLDTGAAITLNLAAGNVFNTINLAARNLADTAYAAGAIAYRSVTGFDIAGIGTTSTLTLQNNNSVGNSPITQSGAMVAGATTITGGATNNVILTHPDNDFTSVATTTGFNVSLFDSNALILGASTISGAFTATAAGAITQSGALVVTLLTTLATTIASDITLTNAANNFSTVNVTNGNNVALRDTNGIVLGAINTVGSFSVVAAGAITQTGSIMTPTLIAKTLGTSLAITLASATNDVGAIDLRSRNSTDTANSTGVINYRDATGFDVANIATTSTVTLTAGGTITQMGGGGILGTTLTAKTLNNSGAGIGLSNFLNNLTTVDLRARNAADTANATGAIAYADTNAIVIAAANTLSTVDIIAGGAITQTGGMTGSTLSAKTLLDAGAAMTLTLATGNAFNTINLFARNLADTANAAGAIAYRSVAGFNVAGVGTTSTLSLQNNNTVTNSAITQTGAITAGTTTILGGTSNDVTLNHVGNDFTTVTTTSGLNVTLADNNGLILGTSAIGGNFNVTTYGGSITQSGILTVAAGTATFASGANNITLNSANNFNTVAISNANNVSFTDANSVMLGTSNIGGTLGVFTNGAITQSGAVAVGGTATFTAGAANNITLTNTNNDFASVAIASGNNVAIGDANALSLAASNVTGNMSASAGGSITDSGNVVVLGANGLTLTSVGGITLDSAGNQFASLSLNNSGGDINISMLAALTIAGFSQAGNGAVNFDTNGMFSVANGVTVNTNNAALNISANNINLNTSGSLNAGAGDINIEAKSGTLGLGLAAGTTSISKSELQRMSARTLVLRGAAGVTILVDGVDAADVANVTDKVVIGSSAANSSVTFANNASSFKGLDVIAALNIDVNAPLTTTTGDLSLTANSLAINTTNITSAGAQTYNGALTFGANASLAANGNITFNNTVNSSGVERDITLDASTIGNILFNADVGDNLRLGAFTINNANNVTNNGLFKANSFTQLGGNITSLGASGLDLIAGAYVVASSITGNLVVAALSLGTSTANLVGSVNGLTGQAAIDEIVLLNTIGPNTHFFDGIDMNPLPPAPPGPGPQPDPTLPIISPQDIFASYLSVTKMIDANALYGMEEMSYFQNTNNGHCVKLRPYIDLCNLF